MEQQLHFGDIQDIAVAEQVMIIEQQQVQIGYFQEMWKGQFPAFLLMRVLRLLWLR